MKSIDLFAGCGGLSLGLKYSGFDVKLATDFKSYACDTYLRNFNNAQYIVDDILNIEKNNWDRFIHYQHQIDLVAGGPPCQGFSNANRQRLSDDPRNKLYKSFLGAVNFIRPKIVLMENVQGIIKASCSIKKEFSSIGYEGDYLLLNAKDFSIPQNRKRVFFIFFKAKPNTNKKIYLDKVSRIKEILNHESINSPEYLLKDALFGLRKLEAKTIKNRTDLESGKYGFIKDDSHSNKQNDYIKNINKRRNTNIVFNHLARYNNERDIKIFSLLPQGKNSLHESISHLMPYKSRNHIFKDKYFKLDENKICKTITAHMSYDCNMYIHPTQARGLTPREAARVQSFPDNFEFCGPYTKWYEQIGNAVPPLLAEKIGKAILKVI